MLNHILNLKKNNSTIIRYTSFNYLFISNSFNVIHLTFKIALANIIQLSYNSSFIHSFIHSSINTKIRTQIHKLTVNESPQYKEACRRCKPPIERNFQNSP